jgi:ubiquitin-protein ligase
MSTKDQQLSSDHKKVVDTIKRYKNITLIGTTGDPADEYDIEYKLGGYSKSSSGKITIAKQHRVKFYLPFGYPHFPPTLKPLSPIFHPDIDANVVRIADYWEKNKSLADLIIHFGEMICGKIYSNENPFNLKAAEYYKRHQNRLPLDSLQLIGDDSKKVQEKPPIEFNIPIFKTLFIVCLLALLGSGGLYFFEKNKLGQVEQAFQKARIFEEDLEYQKANAAAQSALDDLQSILLLRSPSESLRNSIESFMQSQSMQEGLKGKILYEGEYISLDIVHKLQPLKLLTEKGKKYLDNNSTNEAAKTYEEAYKYANVNQLSAEAKKIHDILAGLKLTKLKEMASSSEKAHKSRNWELAISKHKQVLTFIKKEKTFLEDGAKKQASRTRYLLMLDRVALSSETISKPGVTKQELEIALKNYNTLIDSIGKSGPQSNSTMQNTLVESMRQAAIISMKLIIIDNRKWLLENYKEIIPIHYPATIAASLHSPQAVFVRYEGKNLVYDLNCLEKGQGSVVRLRIYYQYNPDTQEWSLYDGEI